MISLATRRRCFGLREIAGHDRRSGKLTGVELRKLRYLETSRTHPPTVRSATPPIQGLERFSSRNRLAALGSTEQSRNRPPTGRVVDRAVLTVCLRKRGSANKGATRLARFAFRGVNDPEIGLGQ
jgi:hypothetical protein